MKRLILFLLLFFFFSEGWAEEERGFRFREDLAVGVRKPLPPRTVEEEKIKFKEVSPFDEVSVVGRVFRVSFSPQGEYLAFSTNKGEVGVYSLEKKEIIWRKKEEDKKPIYCVEFHPLQNIIIYGKKDGSLLVYDIKERKLVKRILETEFSISDVKFSPEGKEVASGHLEDFGVNVYDENYEKLRNIKFYQAVYSISFSPGGELLAVGGRDREIAVIPRGDLKPSQFISGHTFLVLDLEFSPDGKYLASGGADAQLFLWKKVGKWVEPEPLFKWVHPDWVTSVKFFKNYLFSGCKDGKVRIFDYKKRELIKVFEVGSCVYSLSIKNTPWGELVAVGTKENGVKFYKLRDIL